MISSGSAESRQRALWYATDILIAGRYTETEIWMFGEIIARLEQDIEAAARAELSRRLAHTDNAPVNIIKKFAFDDSIDVAGPVLRHSERIDSRTLIANIRSKGQQHLLAISQRRSIGHDVTDELVTRGNQEVVCSLATNHGACFSDFGILHLIKRSEGDSILVELLGHRRDIPRQIFQQLIAKAADNAKKKIERERPEEASQVQALVTEVTGTLHSKFGPASQSYFSAKRLVSREKQIGNLNESRILEYAQSRKFAEVTVGLSLLCSLPVHVVERTLVDKNREMLLILTKVLGFSWETTMSLLFLSASDHRIASLQLDVLKMEYTGLNVETSRSILEMYRSRRHEGAAASGDRRLPQLHA